MNSEEKIADEIVSLLAEKGVSVDAAKSILLLASKFVEWTTVQPRHPLQHRPHSCEPGD